MFCSCDSCMDVATAITAERMPIFLASACCTIVVAFACWPGESCIEFCGPEVGTGCSTLAACGSLGLVWLATMCWIWSQLGAGCGAAGADACVVFTADGAAG